MSFNLNAIRRLNHKRYVVFTFSKSKVSTDVEYFGQLYYFSFKGRVVFFRVTNLKVSPQFGADYFSYILIYVNRALHKGSE